MTPDFEKMIRVIETPPRRKALSSRFPILRKPIMAFKRTSRQLKNRLEIGGKYEKQTYKQYIIARHSSPLRRKLGGSDPALTEGKIQNLKTAIAKLDGIIISAGKIFSLWHTLGRVHRKDGYTDGMLLSEGEAVSGLGGGLCQLSNLLYWAFLHTESETLERHHHSKDVFPDSGRTLPFGTGATIFDNYLDLKIRNISESDFQIKIWMTDDSLKIQLLSDSVSRKKFHVFERNHCFVKKGGKFFRYNEIFRETLIEGKVVLEEKIAANFAPVLYSVTSSYLLEHDYKLVDLDAK